MVHVSLFNTKEKYLKVKNSIVHSVHPSATEKKHKFSITFKNVDIGYTDSYSSEYNLQGN